MYETDMNKMKEEDRKNSDFIVCEPGESFTAEFLGYEYTTNNWGPTRRWHFKMYGKDKGMDCTNMSFVNGMYKIRVNDVVKVTRSAKNKAGKTSYTVEVVEENLTAKEAGLDMADYWKPTSGYFKRIKREQIIEALTEAGEVSGELPEKKSDLAALAAERLAGKWIPKALR